MKLMKSILIFGLLGLLFAALSGAAEQAALKTGLQALPGALPAGGVKDPAIDWNFNLAREKFYIFVPKNYSADQPFGVLVFMDASEERSAVPPGWAKILEEKKLIFVAPQQAGNSQPVSRRLGLAVLAAAKTLELAKLDTNRVYAAGLSGGARVASSAAFLRPALFSGAIAVCGVNFPRQVPRVKATNKDDYG